MMLGSLAPALVDSRLGFQLPPSIHR
jgi:hypothetical protein